MACNPCRIGGGLGFFPGAGAPSAEAWLARQAPEVQAEIEKPGGAAKMIEDAKAGVGYLIGLYDWAQLQWIAIRERADADHSRPPPRSSGETLLRAMAIPELIVGGIYLVRRKR